MKSSFLRNFVANYFLGMLFLLNTYLYFSPMYSIIPHIERMHTANRLTYTVGFYLSACALVSMQALIYLGLQSCLNGRLLKGVAILLGLSLGVVVATRGVTVLAINAVAGLAYPIFLMVLTVVQINQIK